MNVLFFSLLLPLLSSELSEMLVLSFPPNDGRVLLSLHADVEEQEGSSSLSSSLFHCQKPQGSALIFRL